ncbi:2OG-Fe(II) oxygenase [Myxococcota bacterium]|nr:2OG-Fe(II) oxygenase [Myxococcota bacterium]
MILPPLRSWPATLVPAPVFTDAEVQELGSGGLVVREGALGDELAAALRARLEALDAAGALLPAGLGHDGRLVPALRADRAATLEELGADPVLEAVWAWFDRLRQALVEATWVGLPRFSVQLACYPGGGARYARHVDALPGDTNRLFTAIVYLNPAWQPEHGGRLRAWVRGQPRELDPTWDRLVVFRSEAVPHEVLPAWAPRYAAAAWMRGAEAVPALADPEVVRRRARGEEE